MEPKHLAGECPPQPRRLGKINIALAIVRTDRETVVAALKDVMIVRAEAMVDDDRMEYVGEHPDFEELAPGQALPLYEAVMFRTASGAVSRIKWEKRS